MSVLLMDIKRRATFKYWHDPLFGYIRCLFFSVACVEKIGLSKVYYEVTSCFWGHTKSAWSIMMTQMTVFRQANDLWIALMITDIQLLISVINKREVIRYGRLKISDKRHQTCHTFNKRALRSLAIHLRDKSVGINVVLSTTCRGRSSDTPKQENKAHIEARNCFRSW